MRIGEATIAQGHVFRGFGLHLQTFQNGQAHFLGLEIRTQCRSMLFPALITILMV